LASALRDLHDRVCVSRVDPDPFQRGGQSHLPALNWVVLVSEGVGSLVTGLLRHRPATVCIAIICTPADP
jgi:hypothetical protein